MSNSNEKTSFNDFERQAMHERAEELRNQAKNKKDPKAGLADILEKIGEMTDQESKIALAINDIVSEVAPDLKPKTWYSMPAYADQNDQVVLFFKAGSKYNSRINTLGFNDPAKLDNGLFWPTSYAIQGINPEVEAEIRQLIKEATK